MTEIERQTTFTRCALLCDRPTIFNGRTYPRAVIEKALESYTKQIGDRKAFGPAIDGKIELHRVGFVVKGAELVGDRLMVTVETLENGPGQHANRLFHIDGIGLGICGMGTVRKNVVQDDFLIIGFDFTLDPEQRTTSQRSIW